MSFPIQFSCTNSELSELSLEVGELLFVLGANGTGKSSLMHRFAAQNRENVRKISAHRQTWMESDTLDMTPSQKVKTARNIANYEMNPESRHKDSHAALKTSVILFDLINAENVRARNIAADVDAGNMDGATEKSKIEAPIADLNQLLKLSNIPIELSIQENERLMASKKGGVLYSAAELSDGERNALQIVGSVLTAPAGTLLLIDEPERHLHRSIISPLLTHLFARRSDCAFVIATHDHSLPQENPHAKTLLIRYCNYNAQQVQRWDADMLAPDVHVDEVLKQDLLGARRKILFVEGTESSLDKPLYSLIFPEVSVVAKGSCIKVEKAVGGLTSGDQFHWLKAFGIVDSDGFDEETIAAKRNNGVFAVPYYSVEAIYYHPRMIGYISKRQAHVSGDAVETLTQAALEAGITAIREDIQRLCEKAVKKAVEKEIIGQLPDGDTYLSGVNVTIEVDSAAHMIARTAELTAALDANNWEAVLAFCPIRESKACNNIALALKFRSKTNYTEAILNLLATDNDALTFARSLFSDLHQQIEA